MGMHNRSHMPQAAPFDEKRLLAVGFWRFADA
jgi:hypothetical protein